MLIAESIAIEIKNGVVNTRAIPENSNSIETKNGLREYAKIPFITNLPLFEGFSPKRSESLKESSVKHTVTTPNNMMINPGNEIQRVLCRFLLPKSGRMETAIIWL